jgi:hypothetical protein
VEAAQLVSPEVGTGKSRRVAPIGRIGLVAEKPDVRRRPVRGSFDKGDCRKAKETKVALLRAELAQKEEMDYERGKKTNRA